MKAPACVIAAFAGCVFAHAATSPLEWTKSVKLTQKDFRSKVPSSATDAAHSWVGLDVAWECLEGRARSHARAVFDPDQSWWRGSAANIWGGIEEGLSRAQLDSRRTASERDRDLLRHEQLHFDLTELAARKIRQQFDVLPQICATPGRNAEVERSISAIQRAWSEEQIRYDNDTGHGTNQWKQREWERRIGLQIDR